MSAFQPGMANPSTPIFESDTEIITYIPTGVAFPDPIPNGGTISYLTMAPPMNPQPIGGPATSRLFSIVCVVSAANIGNGKGILTFRIGKANPSNNDFIYVLPMSGFINSDLPPAGPGYLISFTGLVKSLPGDIPRLYITYGANTDTTTYDVESIVINYKVL